jgi:cytochrome c biogenesis protein CcdA
VKRAVFALYGITLLFAFVGVSLAALVTLTSLRVRFVYAIALVLFGFIGVIAVKAARHQQRDLAEKKAAKRKRPAT